MSLTKNWELKCIDKEQVNWINYWWMKERKKAQHFNCGKSKPKKDFKLFGSLV